MWDKDDEQKPKHINDPDKSQCSNCKEYVKTQLLCNHERHCKQTVTDCPHCHEKILISELENHVTEQHTAVPCDECGERVLMHQLERHMKESCSRLSIPCEYCEIMLPFTDIERHEKYCGSRTEPCLTCGSFVMYKDLSKHPSQCKPKPKNNDPVKYAKQYRMSSAEANFVRCRFCYENIDIVDLVVHEDVCAGRREICQRCGDDVPLRNMAQHRRRCLWSNSSVYQHGPVTVDSSIYQHGKVAVDSSIYQHGPVTVDSASTSVTKDECQGALRYQGASNFSASSFSYNPVPPSAEEESGFPCEFCNQLFGFTELYDHEHNCTKRPQSLETFPKEFQSASVQRGAAVGDSSHYNASPGVRSNVRGTKCKAAAADDKSGVRPTAKRNTASNNETTSRKNCDSNTASGTSSKSLCKNQKATFDSKLRKTNDSHVDSADVAIGAQAPGNRGQPSATGGPSNRGQPSATGGHVTHGDGLPLPGLQPTSKEADEKQFSVAEEPLQLACEFCGERFVWSRIDSHEFVCGNRLEICQTCGNDVPVRDRKTHFEYCQHRHSSGSRYRTLLAGDQMTDEAAGTLASGTLQPYESRGYNMIACEYCNTEIAFDKLFEHENYCATQLVLGDTEASSHSVFAPDSHSSRAHKSCSSSSSELDVGLRPIGKNDDGHRKQSGYSGLVESRYDRPAWKITKQQANKPEVPKAIGNVAETQPVTKSNDTAVKRSVNSHPVEGVQSKTESELQQTRGSIKSKPAGGCQTSQLSEKVKPSTEKPKSGSFPQNKIKVEEGKSLDSDSKSKKRSSKEATNKLQQQNFGNTEAWKTESSGLSKDNSETNWKRGSKKDKSNLQQKQNSDTSCDLKTKLSRSEKDFADDADERNSTTSSLSSVTTSSDGTAHKYGPYTEEQWLEGYYSKRGWRTQSPRQDTDTYSPTAGNNDSTRKRLCELCQVPVPVIFFKTHQDVCSTKKTNQQTSSNENKKTGSRSVLKLDLTSYNKLRQNAASVSAQEVHRNETTGTSDNCSGKARQRAQDVALQLINEPNPQDLSWSNLYTPTSVACHRDPDLSELKGLSTSTRVADPKLCSAAPFMTGHADLTLTGGARHDEPVNRLAAAVTASAVEDDKVSTEQKEAVFSHGDDLDLDEELCQLLSTKIHRPPETFSSLQNNKSSTENRVNVCSQQSDVHLAGNRAESLPDNETLRRLSSSSVVAETTVKCAASSSPDIGEQDLQVTNEFINILDQKSFTVMDSADHCHQQDTVSHPGDDVQYSDSDTYNTGNIRQDGAGDAVSEMLNYNSVTSTSSTAYDPLNKLNKPQAASEPKVSMGRGQHLQLLRQLQASALPVVGSIDTFVDYNKF